MPAPLEGITVVELANWVQGPLAGQLLANQGASVVKVERPERGDPTRGLSMLYGAKMMTEDGRALLWEICNRNKESLCLDLHQPAGREVFYELIRQADIFLTNLQPGRLESFSCTADELFAVNEQLIYAMGGGLTVNGPLAGAPAQDTVAMAHSGFMLTAGNADGEPAYPPGALADVTAASSLASGVMSALLSRDRHGTTRQVVTTSLVHAMAWTQMLGVAVPANTGDRLRPFEHGKAANPLMSVYQAGDGRWLALGMVSMSDRVWRAFCDAVDRREWYEDADWGLSYEDRARAAVEIGEAIQALFLTKPAAEWVEVLRARDIPCSMVNHPAELPLDENIRADGIVARGADGLAFLTGPFALNGVAAGDRPAPALGQDGAAVLARFGYGEQAIAALYENGVVW